VDRCGRHCPRRVRTRQRAEVHETRPDGGSALSTRPRNGFATTSTVPRLGLRGIRPGGRPAGDTAPRADRGPARRVPSSSCGSG
jgi:hypothetical protein